MTRLKESKNAKYKVRLLIGFVALLLIIVIGYILVSHGDQSTRSVANFCTVRQQETTRLSKLPKPNSSTYTYSSAVFPNVSASASEIVQSLGQVENVAPSDVRPYVQTIHTAFTKIDQDPTAGFDTIYANTEIQMWIRQHCGQ